MKKDFDYEVILSLAAYALTAICHRLFDLPHELFFILLGFINYIPLSHKLQLNLQLSSSDHPQFYTALGSLNELANH